jgi:hypothetical protein
MRKSLWLVALVISSSFVGAVAADGVSTTSDQAFLRELAQRPETPVFETLSRTPPPKATYPEHCQQTFCRYNSDCAPPVCLEYAACRRWDDGFYRCDYDYY